MRFATLSIALATAILRTQAQPPAEERPAITVATFSFGAVSTPARGEANRRGPYDRRGSPAGYDASPLAQAIGTGAADLVVEKLVESRRFRVFERVELDAVRREQLLGTDSADGVARARYVVTGSVSHVGHNDDHVGGLLVGAALGQAIGGGFGMLNTRSSSTTVKLTARVVDTRTGEIIGSFTGEGESRKRWDVGVVHAAGRGAGGGSVGQSNFRETAIGEATSRAAAAVAAHVIALRATTLRP